MPPERIAAILAEKGIEKFYREGLPARKVNIAPPSQKVQPETAAAQQVIDELPETTLFDNEPAKENGRPSLKVVDDPTKKVEVMARAGVRVPKFVSGFCLHVEVTEALFNRVIKLRSGKITLEVSAPEPHVEGEFRRLTAIEAVSKAERRVASKD